MSNSVGICKVGLLEACLRLMVDCNTLSWFRIEFGLECAVQEQLPLQELSLFLCCLPLAGQFEECWQGQHQLGQAAIAGNA